MNLANIVCAYLKQESTPNLLNSFELKVLQDIVDCRTHKLGGHIMACPECGSIKVYYNSCGNRHCPQCGGFKRDKWALERKTEALDVKYFHVVFTAPHELNPLFKAFPKIMDGIMMQCSWEVISCFGRDHKFLGGQMGMISVLHTWGQNLSLHPHIHCLVPGGGISKQGIWREMKKSNGKFLFPVKALSIVFKAKLLAAICKLYKNGTISAPETVQNFYDWINSMHKKKWVVYAKKPVPKGVSIVEYLAKYTHKVAISNSRIIKFENKVVTFSYLDYRTSKIVIMEIGIDEFIRRFLMHMLPKGFVKIRYYGFLSNRNKKAILVRIRVQIGQSPAQNFKGLP